MTRWLCAVLALLVCLSGARAASIDAYLAECTAVGTGTCTELTGGTYARQAVSFSDLVKGNASLSTPYSFGSGAAGTIAGRALYDAATGGNLLAVIPLATPVVSPPVDQSDVGTIKLSLPALASFQNANPFYGTFAAGSTLGTSGDGSTVTAGVKLVLRTGKLTAALPAFDASYIGPVTMTTGFTVTNLTNQATFIVGGAGTLSTGAIQMPSAPLDGATFRLSCQVTVTTLTLSVMTGSGQTLINSPTTCGPAAGHEWFYLGPSKTWSPLF